jgi:hypothetical protein
VINEGNTEGMQWEVMIHLGLRVNKHFSVFLHLHQNMTAVGHPGQFVPP